MISVLLIYGLTFNPTSCPNPQEVRSSFLLTFPEHLKAAVLIADSELYYFDYLIIFHAFILISAACLSFSNSIF